MKLKIILSSVLMGGAVCAFGQKKPLDHSVYDAWQSVGSRQISNDGKWIGYNVDPQEGDTRLYLTSPKSSHNLQFSRGTVPSLPLPEIPNSHYSPLSHSSRT